MTFDFTGKRAIVCGGSRGIGRAIALGFAGRRRRCRSAPAAPKRWSAPAARSRRSATTPTPAFATWPTPPRSRRYITDAAAALGGIDVLVNNASASGRRTTTQGWGVSFAVDMMAIVHATQAALPYLKEAQGSVVNIILDRGTAFRGAAAAVRRDQGRGDPLHQHPGGDVRQGRHPGELHRPGLDRVSRRRVGPAQDGRPTLYNAVLKSIPFGRLGHPEEVANVALFLASPLASG